MPGDDDIRGDLEQLFPELTLTVEEIAGRLRRCEASVHRAIRRGDLASLSGLGRPYVMTRSAVITWALGDALRTTDSAVSTAPAPVRDMLPETGTSPASVSRVAVQRRRAMASKRKAA